MRDRLLRMTEAMLPLTNPDKGWFAHQDVQFCTLITQEYARNDKPFFHADFRPIFILLLTPVIVLGNLTLRSPCTNCQKFIRGRNLLHESCPFFFLFYKISKIEIVWAINPPLFLALSKEFTVNGFFFGQSYIFCIFCHSYSITPPPHRVFFQ